MLKPLIAFCVVSAVIFSSCKKTVTSQKPIQIETLPLVEIGTQKFSTADFQSSYEKNKSASDSSKTLTPHEYLGLYTNLKIKVLQAKQEGKDTAADYKDEINSYRGQLAKNFLVDKSLVEKLATEAYTRMKQEIRASHILVAVSEDASPQDTLQAHNAAVALRGRLEEGTDFGDLASKFSKDPSAKINKGDLGYFTTFQTVYPFENAAYALSEGKISQPVRSKMGYHIIKVINKRANRGLVRIAHIMLSVDSTSTPAQREIAKSRIDEAYAKLENGEDWNTVVSTYSSDSQSKKNQGLLPAFGIGQMVPEIEEAAFSLPKIGSYSKPVLTIYGWHIVKLVEKKGLESYATLAPSLRQKVVTDSRGKLIDQINAQRLRKKYIPIEMAQTWKEVSALVDSSLIKGKWDYMKAVSADWANATLFTIDQTPYYALDFLNAVKKNQKMRPAGSSPSVVFKRYYDEYLMNKLSEYERENLEKSSPEFRELMDEIEEGVLLSQVMEENVWQRSLSDSAGQRKLYEKIKDRYVLPERARAFVISAPDTQTVGSIRKTILQSPYKLERKADELLFAEGISDFNKNQLDQLYDLYAILENNPDYSVEVAGYRTASEGEATSASRIKNVVKYLNSKKISIVRIMEKDYGSFRQAFEPERNRRVGFQFYSTSLNDVQKVYNSETPGAVMIQEGYFVRESPYFTTAKWQAGEQLVQSNGKSVWLKIDKIEPSRIKTFNEARGSVINEYQKELEKQWLASLQQKFPVKVNDQELEKIKR